MNVIRNNIKDKFNSLELDGEKIEEKIYNFTIDFCKNNDDKITIKSKIFKDLYLNKARQIYHNLDEKSYVKNNYLLKSIKNKKYNIDNICNHQYDKLNPTKWKKYSKDLEILNKEIYTFDREIQATDQFTCKKCKKNKCVYSQYQIRSSDEGITSFITCLNCGNNWREN